MQLCSRISCGEKDPYETATFAFNQLRSEVKEKVGKAKNDPDLVAEGTDEKLGGKIQKKVGDIKTVFGA